MSGVRRREFITLLCGAAAVWPRAAHAQKASNLPRVGSIHTTRSENSEAFFQGLREAGYADGQNVLLESRFSEGELGPVDEFAHELVALNCSVIFASNPYAIRAAMKATQTIPIVGIDLEDDPVASGWAQNLARPGGNLTGVFLDLPELGGKQIELLKEAVPTLSRLAVLWDATIGTVQFRATETAPARGHHPSISPDSPRARRRCGLRASCARARRWNGPTFLSAHLL